MYVTQQQLSCIVHINEWLPQGTSEYILSSRCIPKVTDHPQSSNSLATAVWHLPTCPHPPATPPGPRPAHLSARRRSVSAAPPQAQQPQATTQLQSTTV